MLLHNCVKPRAYTYKHIFKCTFLNPDGGWGPDGDTHDDEPRFMRVMWIMNSRNKEIDLDLFRFIRLVIFSDIYEFYMIDRSLSILYINWCFWFFLQTRRHVFSEIPIKNFTLQIIPNFYQKLKTICWEI